MRLEDFAEITQRVIRKEGFDGFLPTLCLPEQKHLTVLEGVPEGRPPEMRSLVLAWARRNAGDQQEFLVAFREGNLSFRIVRSLGGVLEERVFVIE